MMSEDVHSDRPGRGQKQERSLQRRSRITDAAIDVLAMHGVSGLTHRLVARRAEVSLAATTYYFHSKFDIVTEASRRALQGYTDAFARTASRLSAHQPDPAQFRRLAVRLLCNAVSRDRLRALCWAEITLDAHRHPESLALTRQWFEELAQAWTDIAQGCGLPLPEETARSAIDLVIGLLLLLLALDLTAEQIEAVLLDEADPLTAWTSAARDSGASAVPVKHGRKALETRKRIIDAAIEVLVSDGPGAVTYRTVAARGGLTPAGPFYHFPTIDGLISAAQRRLFEESKQRYREVAAEIGHPASAEQVIDRTATVLVREATQFAGHNLASYAIWVQAARSSGLRPLVWSVLFDQYRAWDRLLAPLAPARKSLDPLIAFCLFVGMQVRILSTGSDLEALTRARSEFAQDFQALLDGGFWLQNSGTIG